MLKIQSLAFLIVALCGTLPVAGANDALDPDLAEYTKASGVSGNISSVGSDTLGRIQAPVSEREHPGAGRRIEYRAAGPDGRHVKLRSDES